MQSKRGTGRPASSAMTSNFKLARRWPQNPPPVPKKPSIEFQEKQRRFEQRAAMEGQQQTAIPPPPPPPVGYNDADRFYVASPPPSENSLVVDHQEMEPHQQKFSSRPGNDPLNSAWLSKKLDKIDEKQKDSAKLPTNAQTDTKDLPNNEENRRRKMEEQLGDLKAENRAKTRELKTNKYIENEMNRKLKTADDAYVLRHTVKDKDRLINNQEKIIAELTAENAKLAEDLAERDRQVFQLQSEVDNLDRVIVAKKALKEAERLQAVGEDLDKAKDDLANANFEIETARNELKNVQSVVARKDREIKSKNDHIEQLTKQLTQAETKIAGLENEKLVADNHSKAANREAKLLKEQNDKLVDFKERCNNLEEENAYMAEAIRTLEAKILQLESIKHDKEVLDDLVHDLKSALKDKNQIAKDRRNLMIETQQLRDLLREKTVDEEALQKELYKLKGVLSELEKENNFYRDLDVDFRRLKQKYEEIERERFKNELVLAKLRPRVERLQNRCKEKDDLIRRLANELRSGGDRYPRDLLQEADRNQNSALNDYIDMDDYLDGEPLSAQVRRSRDRRPHASAHAQRSPMAAYEPAKGSRKASKSPSRGYEQDRAPSRPPERYSYGQQQPERHFPSREFPETEEPRRAQHQQNSQQPTSSGRDPQRNGENYDNPARQQPQRKEHSNSRLPPPTAWEIPRNESSPQNVPEARTNDGVYEETIRPTKREDEEARKQPRGYDPTRLADRDDPHQYAREQPVRQYPNHSEPNAQPGAYEPSIQRGYQEPNQRDAEGGRKPDLTRNETYPVLDQRQSPVDNGRMPYSAEKSPAYQELHQPNEHNQLLDHQNQHQQAIPQHMDPPVNVRAQYVPDSGNLQIEWDIPALDELDRSNGVVVAGYKIFVNGTEQQPVVSSRVTKSIVPRSALGEVDVNALRISVQSYSYDGDTSDKANISVPPPSPRPVVENNSEQQREPTPTAPLTVEVEQPTQHQPANNDPPMDSNKPTNQDPSSDRPASPEQQQQQKQPVSSAEAPEEDRFRTRDNSPAGAAARLGLPPPSPQSFVRKALYDYQPSQHSPSAFPPFELELHRGDDVQTFGPVRPDGMYNAEVNGKRGLVPAQYLKLN
ncbi:hypothetical protein BOX15_Mlig015536g1 [Macrostomum lignano]|uniref:SH3 domain-containing protein n=1 Tax=Macrostomum lignano TaxID=282301 RepID=A0A267G2C0_9PLAT|nr:hypothetical protein BOX15_Mlig015536g1 [Macrostomum lignano]